MKKVVLLGLLASGLMSAESGLYVGVDVYKTRTNLTVSNGAASEKQNLTRPSQTLKAGYYLNNNNRINAFYQHSNTWQDTKGCLYGIGYDYLIGDHDFKPFIGVLLGYSKYSQINLVMDGGFVGADAGLNYAFGENMSVEGGYRYMRSNASGTFTTSASEAKADTLSNWFIGGNYKF